MILNQRHDFCSFCYLCLIIDTFLSESTQFDKKNCKLKTFAKGKGDFLAGIRQWQKLHNPLIIRFAFPISGEIPQVQVKAIQGEKAAIWRYAAKNKDPVPGSSWGWVLNIHRGGSFSPAFDLSIRRITVICAYGSN